MYRTSNDANTKVEGNDGVPKGGSYHSNRTQHSTQHCYWPAPEVTDQHAAHWSCKEEEEDKEKDGESSSE